MTPQGVSLEDITPKQRWLVALLRRVGYGKVLILIKNGEPIRVEYGIKSEQPPD